VTCQLNEWRNDQWSATLESLDPEDQLLWKMAKLVMRFPTPSPPLFTPGGIALSDSEKAEALVDSLEAQFQPVNNPLEPTRNEKIDKVMTAYFLPLLVNPI